jgi:hypothetical protein
MTKLKTWREWDGHSLARLGVEPMKLVISAGVVLVLVVAWVLTNPLFQLSDRFAVKK